MAKDRTQKNADEMDFNEFVIWSTGYVLFGIAEGQTLRSVMFAICQSAAMNKVWGGNKPIKKAKNERQ
jgi:hypothetical protein